MTSEITKVATIDESDSCYGLDVCLLPSDVVRLGDDNYRGGQIVEVSVADIPSLIAALQRVQEMAEERRNGTAAPRLPPATPVGPSSDASVPPGDDPEDWGHCRGLASTEDRLLARIAKLRVALSKVAAFCEHQRQRWVSGKCANNCPVCWAGDAIDVDDQEATK